MVEKWLTWIHNHKKQLIWFLILVVFPISCTLKIMEDAFLPEPQWEESYFGEFFSPISKKKEEKRKVDIVAFYDSYRNAGDRVYGIPTTLFHRKLIYALEDQEKISEFLRIINSAEMETIERNKVAFNSQSNDEAYCPIKHGQKEIHVIAFDYSNNEAGYFYLHWCGPKEEVVLINFYTYILESAEMAVFLKSLGMEP